MPYVYIQSIMLHRYWRCIRRSKCPGRLQTTVVCDNLTPEIITGPTEHNHEPETKRAIRGRAISALRDTVKGAPFQPLKTSYDALVACDPVSDHDRVLFPSFSSLTTILKLQKSDDIPKLPKAKVDINLTGEWTVNLEGLRFLLETTAENDITIFATDANLRCLSACDSVYGRYI